MAKAVISKENVILIVDKDLNRRNTFSSRLRHTGYQTELASSGFQAVHMVEKSKDNNKFFTLVMLVSDADDMPGREILNLMRTIANKKELPILVMNKEKDPEAILEIMKEGANDFLVLTDNFQKILQKAEKLAPIK